MPDEQLAVLTRQLRIAHRNLADDAPHSPAWAATTEWVDDLKQEIRELGTALGLVVSIALLERTRVA
jgi:hypothetical protein